MLPAPGGFSCCVAPDLRSDTAPPLLFRPVPACRQAVLLRPGPPLVAQRVMGTAVWRAPAADRDARLPALRRVAEVVIGCDELAAAAERERADGDEAIGD